MILLCNFLTPKGHEISAFLTSLVKIMFLTKFKQAFWVILSILILSNNSLAFQPPTYCSKWKKGNPENCQRKWFPNDFSGKNRQTSARAPARSPAGSRLMVFHGLHVCFATPLSSKAVQKYRQGEGSGAQSHPNTDPNLTL